MGLPGLTDTIVTMGRWPVLAPLSVAALWLLYRYSPGRKSGETEHQSRRNTTRGRVRPLGQRAAAMADMLGRTP
jgi:hypothetical protein